MDAQEAAPHRPVAVILHSFDLMAHVLDLMLLSIAAHMPLRELGWHLYVSTETAHIRKAVSDRLPKTTRFLRLGKRRDRKYDFVSSLQRMLSYVKEDRLIYLQEDFFILQPINASEMYAIELLSAEIRADAVYLWTAQAPCTGRVVRQRPEAALTVLRDPTYYVHRPALWRTHAFSHALDSPSDGSAWSQETSQSRPLGRSYWSTGSLATACFFCAQTSAPSFLRHWGSMMHLGHVVEDKLPAVRELAQRLGVRLPDEVFERKMQSRVEANFSHEVSPMRWLNDARGGRLNLSQRLIAEQASREWSKMGHFSKRRLVVELGGQPGWASIMGHENGSSHD
mmetsp:Transcript_40325/g.91321  ORF Transcript_40325/g.91321 Transcript_40325/m.91321 type:complete len:339 (-) Transcript_40325:304-1320(-)